MAKRKKDEPKDGRNAYLFGEVTPESICELMERMEELHRQEPDVVIDLHISSQGGDFFPAIGLVDAIRAGVFGEVHTWGWGEVCSAASYILAAGHYRRMGKMGAVMLHPASIGMERHNSWVALRSLKGPADAEERMLLCMDKLTRREPGSWASHLRRAEELWLNATEALDYGLVDEVVGHR